MTDIPFQSFLIRIRYQVDNASQMRMEKGVKTMGLELANLGLKALGAAAAVGAFATKYSIDLNKISLTAQRVGAQSIKQFEAIKQAAESVWVGSGEQIAGEMAQFASYAAENANIIADRFSQIGATYDKNASSITNYLSLYKRAMAMKAEGQDPRTIKALMGDLLGSTSIDMAIRVGDPFIKAIEVKEKAIGDGMDKAAEQAHQFTQVLENIKNKVADSFFGSGILSTITDEMTKGFNELEENIWVLNSAFKAVADLLKFYFDIGKDYTEFKEKLGEVKDGIEGWKKKHGIPTLAEQTEWEKNQLMKIPGMSSLVESFIKNAWDPIVNRYGKDANQPKQTLSTAEEGKLSYIGGLLKATGEDVNHQYAELVDILWESGGDPRKKNTSGNQGTHLGLYQSNEELQRGYLKRYGHTMDDPNTPDDQLIKEQVEWGHLNHLGQGFTNVNRWLTANSASQASIAHLALEAPKNMRTQTAGFREELVNRNQRYGNAAMNVIFNINPNTSAEMRQQIVNDIMNVGQNFDNYSAGGFH